MPRRNKNVPPPKAVEPQLCKDPQIEDMGRYYACANCGWTWNKKNERNPHDADAN